jgi:energy-dependent translational throttle protein EttA
LTDGFSVGIVPQEPRLTPNKTVLENVEEAVVRTRNLLAKQEEIGNKMAEASPEEFDKLSDQMDKVQAQIDAIDAYNLDRQLEIAMDAMRLPPGDAPVEQLSGGERRRVALCKMMLQRPDLLLLDEPTNHLDAESVAWLERHLQEYTGTVVSVTHDRYFLDNVAQWILELDRGQGIPFKGNYSSWLEQKQERLRKEEKSVSARQKTLERELEWARMAPRARIGKNKARLAAYEKLASQEYEEREDDLVIQIPPGPHLGDLVVRAQGVKKSFGDNLLFEDMNFDLPKGGIVGVIGPNGAGKTTLFKMIVGLEKPDAGTLTVGPTVQAAHVDQNRDALDPNKTIFEEITGGTDFLLLGKRKVASRGYVARFNFKGPDQQKKVGECSGGERNRIHLAKLLRSGGNLLLLDEPTNDLDVDTLRALEDAIVNFGGCAVVISHDRWFLDRIATHVLAFEGDSTVVWCEGNYQVYEEQRHARLGAAADQPHRVKYKKLRQ